MVFGKNYDKEIKSLEGLISQMNKNIEKIIDLRKSDMELFSSMQESVIQMAKIQAQHKEFIQFFIKHGTVDVDAQEDLIKMIQEMSSIDKLGRKKK